MKIRPQQPVVVDSARHVAQNRAFFSRVRLAQGEAGGERSESGMLESIAYANVTRRRQGRTEGFAGLEAGPPADAERCGDLLDGETAAKGFPGGTDRHYSASNLPVAGS